MIDWKQKYRSSHHSGNRKTVMRNPVISMCHWIPGAGFKPRRNDGIFVSAGHYITAGFPSRAKGSTSHRA